MCGFLRSERGRRRLAGGALLGQWRAWGGAAGAAPRGAAMNDPRCLTAGPRGARPRGRQGPSPHGTPAATASGDTRHAHRGHGVLWQRALPVAAAPLGYREERKVMIRAIISRAEQWEQGQAWAAGRGRAALASSAVRPTELGDLNGGGPHAPFLRVACREL